MQRSIIKGCGHYLPEKVLTNKDLEAIVDTEDEWIVQRTGIRERRIVAEGEMTSDLAFHAAKMALDHAGVTAQDIDALILATTTPDQTFPATAVTVQDRLGMRAGSFAFDVQAVCSGFIFALATADNFMRAGQIKRALVIGAERLSSILNWEDRTTCVLFGDGAGAVVLDSEQVASSETNARGILSTHLHSDGSKRDILYADPKIVMQGKEVFKLAVNKMSAVVEEALKENGIDASEIKYLVPHQANSRIIMSTAEKLGLSPEQVILTVDRHGNTSAASIPLALSEVMHEGRIEKGDLILMEALGGGLTWGAALARM